MNIKKELPKVKENVSLASQTTFKVGGRARYFFEAKSEKDLVKALRAARKFKLAVFVLGKGSNVLFSDEGFDGLVIKCRISSIKYKKNIIVAGAGTDLNRLVKSAKKKSLKGLEWAEGIPGAVGGAVCGNAQAFGTRMSEIVEKVKALDIETLTFKNFSQKECCFSIKNSIFKRKKNLIIVSVVLKLKKGDIKEIEKQSKEYLAWRRKKHPLEFPSAGSVFVNKEEKVKFSSSLLKKFPELKEFNKRNLIPSAYLIEKCGLKGKKINNAQISQKHANFIVNLGGAKAKDLIKLIREAKKKVKKKFGIELKEEIQIIKKDYKS